MRIRAIDNEPRWGLRYLNAGRGPGKFTSELLPIQCAVVEGFPPQLSAMVVTSDLQGRETFESGAGRLLMET